MLDSEARSTPRRSDIWYGRKDVRFITWFLSVAFYATVILTLGDILKISNNYFVIIPLIAASFAYGWPGGVVSGILALPANLALFALIGHREYAPENLVIAECSGIIVGTTMGFLGERFRRLEGEIRRRIVVERTLRATLDERNLLIQEIHHRVKNNLSVIKGMVSLQRMTMDDENCAEAFGELANRLMALSLVQDQLNEKTHFTREIDVSDYLARLVTNIEKVHEGVIEDVRVRINDGLPRLHIDRAAPLGILVNEVVTNAYKHAAPAAEAPMLRVDVSMNECELVIVVADNGPGYDGGSKGDKGLGRDLIDALSSQIRGRVRFDDTRGTAVTITLPVGDAGDDADLGFAEVYQR